MVSRGNRDKKMRLGPLMKLSYGMGHVLNDLCASMWFTYLLIFYMKVVGLSSINAGAALLVGQIADAFSTPVVGILSDRWKSKWAVKYGRRKTWHLIGTVCVLISVPFMYSPCLGCEHSEEWKKLIYYSVFIVIFQFGWASVQISHLSLVPDLTSCEIERTSLLSIRYSFTVIANITVYSITWAVLAISSSGSAKLGAADMIKFQEIAYTVCVCGAITSIIFHLTVRENPVEPLIQENTDTEPKKRLPISQLFSNIRLYTVAVIYMSARLFCNISQSEIPLYLSEVLSLGPTSLAIIPLVMYLSSFCTSVVTGPMNKICGRKVTVVLGSLVGIGGSVWILFGVGEFFKTYLIYVTTILFGCASSILLITSLAITADLIGEDIGNGALVYGLMSFVDKLSSGAVIMIIQYLKPDGKSNFYQDAVSYVCGGSAILCILFTFTIKASRRSNDNLTPESVEEI